MRIHEIQIENVRGIKSLQIAPKGSNFVVWGPNGSGKSAVVDAIDFLITGRISRLTGRGTGGITLSRHGPHIDSSPEEANVHALVSLPGIPDPFKISRSMDQPGVLVCDEDKAPFLDPVIDVARRRQHVLSRREILKFITAESASRATGIQELLDLSEVENIRKALVSVMKESDRGIEAAVRNVDTAKSSVNATVQIEEFSEEVVIASVNQNREILGADPTSSLQSSELKEGVSLPKSTTGEQTINVTILERDFHNIKTLISVDHQKNLAQTESQLRSTLSSIRSDPENLLILEKRRLLEIGLSLLQETGECPLCETIWPQGELKSQLEDQLSKAKAAHEQQEQIEELSTSIVKSISAALASLEKITAALETAGSTKSVPVMRTWLDSLKELRTQLSEALGKYPDEKYSKNQVIRLLAPERIEDQLDKIIDELKEKYPEASPEQTAWDTLTRLAENLKVLESANKAHDNAVSHQALAHALHDNFIVARDEILGNLYHQISARFSELYMHLHGSDETHFTAMIEPDGAGLSLGVDFYGRGIHPPHALHSEGHQDSMGICLYLALAERLTQGLIDLTILDDVVMSVDSSHRRDICTLISDLFPDRQFLITTHDKTWANQLRSEGIVNKDGMVEFYKWDIDTGPYVNLESDLWHRLDSFLDNNDVSNASSLLRRGSEEFFAFVCDSIEAKVKFRLDGRNDLGDFLPSAIGKYNSLLKQAKKSAQSWSKKDLFDLLNEQSTTASQIYQRTLAEQWAINASIHFNKWANLSREDFIPVREAFQDLHALFICQNCGSVLCLVKHGMASVTVRCDCGEVNWNLIVKDTS